MTLSEELYTIMNMIKENDPQSDVSESLVYSLWKKERAVVLSQELSRKNKIPAYLYKNYCLELEQVKSVDCQCELLQDMGCDILRSSVDIPEWIQGNTISSLGIYDLGWKKIGLVNPEDIKSDMLDPVKSKVARAIIPENGKLELWNNIKKNTIYIRMIPADPLAWRDIKRCDGTCPDPYAETYSLPEAQSERVHKMVVQLYLNTMGRLQDDRSQDRNPNTN